jgi:dinuclear metal center YbgI/SA1388 family protein
VLPTLDARLSAAAELVRPGEPVADIGCDHGKLTAVLAASGKYPKVIGADLRPGPLAKAEQTLEYAGCKDRAELRLGDGLSVLSPGEVSTIVLAGVSAQTTWEIIEKAPWVSAPGGPRLVMVPATRHSDLRRWLWEHGFAFAADRPVQAAGRWYAVMAAEYTGQVKTPTFQECLFGLTGQWPEGEGYAAWQKAKLPRLRLGVPDGTELAKEMDELIKGGEQSMTTVQQIYEEMQRIAPLALAESWDNPGLLVDCGGEVSRVLVTLDITPEVVEEAARKGCGLIVSHHPVIFSPLKKLSGQDVAFQLVKSGISAICMHTNLDAAEGGVNEVLAGIFGMREMEAFAEGCGRVGSIEPVTVPELAKKAQKELASRCNQPFNGPAVQVKFADTGKTVRRLAVISGAGGSLFEDAIAQGADCLLTGEANHHHAIDAKRLGLSLIAAGHYATEFPVTAAVAEKLRTAFPELEVLVSEDARDPYTYL